MNTRHLHKYRSGIANTFHEDLRDYIDDKLSLREMDELISRLANQYGSYDFMLEVDQEGRSQLINSLFYCLKTFANEKEEIKNKANEIWDLFKGYLQDRMITLCLLRGKDKISSLHFILQVADTSLVSEYFEIFANSEKDLSQLLFLADSQGFTPLHKALASKEFEIVKIYFARVNNAVAKRYMSRSEYEKLICNVTDENYSSFLNALITKKPQIVKFYLTEIHNAFSLIWLSRVGLNSLYMHVNSSGYSTMHETFISEEDEIVDVYFDSVRAAYKASILTKQNVKDLFCKANNFGFTTLLEALYAKNVRNLKTYLSQVRWAITEGILTGADFQELLSRVNSSGYSPLHQALSTKIPQIVNILFEETMQAHEDKILTDDNLWDLFCKPNEKLVTSVHHALMSRETAIVDVYFAKIHFAINKKILNFAHYKNLLCCPNHLNYSPLVQALNSEKAAIVKAYKQEVDELYNQKALLAEDVKFLLITTTTDESFTPLQIVLRTAKGVDLVEKDKIAKIYLEWVSFAYTNHILLKDDIKYLFTHATSNGFNPLHFVLMKGRLTTAKLYCGYLLSAINQNIISNAAFKVLISQVCTPGFNPLHQALIGGDLNIVGLYFDLLIVAYSLNAVNLDELEDIFCHRRKTRNILHSACEVNNLVLLEKLVKFMRQIFGNERAHKILDKLKNQKTQDGYVPTAKGGLSNPLNVYLNNLNDVNISTSPLAYSGLLEEIPFIAPVIVTQPVQQVATVKNVEPVIEIMGNGSIGVEPVLDIMQVVQVKNDAEYATQKAQYFYLLLTDFISCKSKEALQKVDEFLFNNPERSYLFEWNKHGDTFLMVILRDSFVKITDEVHATKIVAALLNTFIKRLTLDEIANLWKLKARNGLTTPMHKVLKANIEILEIYLMQLSLAYNHGKLNQADIKTLFCGFDTRGKAPIHCVLPREQIKAQQMFFDFAWHVYRNGSLSSSEIKGIFRHPTRNDFPLILRTLHLRSAPILNIYLFQLEIAFSVEKLFSIIEMKNILAEIDRDGMNILHILCQINNFELAECLVGFVNKIFGEEDAKSFLSVLFQAKNVHGYTPAGVSSGSQEVFHFLNRVVHPPVAATSSRSGRVRNRDHDSREHSSHNDKRQRGDNRLDPQTQQPEAQSYERRAHSSSESSRFTHSQHRFFDNRRPRHREEHQRHEHRNRSYGRRP